MKRWILFLLCLMLLTGCGVSRDEMEQPVKFYYCYRDPQTGAYGEETGALGWEIRDLGPVPLRAEEILQLYLQGPEEITLKSAFPEDVTLNQAVLRDGTLSVDLGETAGKLHGIDRTLASACLMQTMLQFSDITFVEILCEGQPYWDGGGTMESFLMLDDTATSDVVTMKLYYGAPDGRYLMEESRSQSFQMKEEIPLYILQQLVDGPQLEGGTDLFPDGVRILDVKNENGVCTVDFSESFLWYQPTTHIGARQLVLSVANTLTELPEIACVKILCGGDSISYYMGLDLRVPIYRDETALQKSDQDCADVTIYVPCGVQERLAPVPMELEQTDGRVQIMDVLGALLTVETINSYVNPFPKGTMVLSADVKDGHCTITFNAAFAMCDADPVQANKAVRSVVATLCDLDGIDRVSIEIHNGKLTSVDLSEPITVSPAWLLP